jgi:Na+/H+ antiporter NhaC
MLETRERSRRNRTDAFALAGAMAMASAIAGWFYPPILLSFALSVHLLVGSTAMRPAAKDYGTAVPHFVGIGTSSSRSPRSQFVAQGD